MIKYRLVCKGCDLSFDSWFASSQEYDKLKNGDEQAAKYYFSKAKANRYSKNVLAQAIYNKDIREDAITTLESFKY